MTCTLGSAGSRRESRTTSPADEVAPDGRRPHARRPVMGTIAMVWMMTATLAGCSAGALSGHAAPLLSTLSAGAPGPTSGAGTGAGSATAPGPGGQIQPATTQPSRPYRPDSVLLGLFRSNLTSPTCVVVAAGSSGTDFTLHRFVERGLCFTGLDTLALPSIVITTPDGATETMPLQSPGSGAWEYVLFPVPGRGAEADLGEYAFQVTTAIAGTGSASPSPTTSPAPGGPGPSITTTPTAGVVTTSGHFTVIPAAQPSVAVGNDALTAGPDAVVSAGSQLHIWFSGFPSFSLVYVSLYGPGPGAAGRYPLLADLPAVKTDQYGEGDAPWAVPPVAAAARYAVWIDPQPAGCTNPCAAFTAVP